MKYTYRNECFISRRDDLVSVIFILILSCCDLGFYLAGLVFYLIDGRTTFLVYGVCLTIALSGMVWSLKISIKARRKVALAIRNRALTQGIRYEGKIVDAGMKIEKEKYEEKDDHDNWKTYYRQVQNYWIDVEYFEPKSGERKRTRASYMVRSMEHLIGCEVDVYIWQEWSDYSQMEFTNFYVDTCHL